MWRLLRDRRFTGLKFRRQVVIDRFIVDFVCSRLKLVVEVEGEVHEQPDQEVRDREREAVLEGMGYSVLRVSNRDVLEQPEAVLGRLAEWLQV